MGTARTNPAALLVGLLIFLALAAGCGENEENREEGAPDPATEQEPQPTDEESTEERAEARNEGSEDATLEMRGDEGTEFSGSCTIGDETSEVEGQVPQSFDYELDGEGLDCEINAEGDLEVIFTAEDTRSVQQISGGTLDLTYEDGRISSVTTSSGGGSSSSQVVSSSQSSSSSINISP